MASQQHNLEADHLAWLKDLQSLGERICRYYGHAGDLSPAGLDAVFRTWKDDDPSARPPDDTLVQGLGAAFGNFLVTKHDASWILVSDEFGTELAVVNNRTGFQTFPFSAIWKRISTENKELAFFEPIASTFENLQIDGDSHLNIRST